MRVEPKGAIQRAWGACPPSKHSGGKIALRQSCAFMPQRLVSLTVSVKRDVSSVAKRANAHVYVPYRRMIVSSDTTAEDQLRMLQVLVDMTAIDFELGTHIAVRALPKVRKQKKEN